MCFEVDDVESKQQNEVVPAHGCVLCLRKSFKMRDDKNHNTVLNIETNITPQQIDKITKKTPNAQSTKYHLFIIISDRRSSNSDDGRPSLFGRPPRAIRGTTINDSQTPRPESQKKGAHSKRHASQRLRQLWPDRARRDRQRRRPAR